MGGAATACRETVAKSFLERFSWDLMRAVDDFYANGGDTASSCVVRPMLLLPRPEFRGS